MAKCPIKYPWGGPKRKGRSRVIEWLMAHVNYDGEECLIWPFATLPTGYGHGAFQGQEFRAHRKMCELVHGPAPSEIHDAAHSCGQASCVHPKHVRWLLPKDNHAEKIRHGTHLSGFRSPSSKLSPEQVKIARETPMVRRGDFTRLAKQLAISTTSLKYVRSGRTYK